MAERPPELRAAKEVLASAARAKYEALESRLLQAQGTQFLEDLVKAHKRATGEKNMLLEAQEDLSNARDKYLEYKADEREARMDYEEERAKLNALMRQADARASPWP